MALRSKGLRHLNHDYLYIFFSYGSRQTIAALLRKLKQQSRDKMKSRKAEMIESLKKLGDFVVDLKWDFNSWLPLVSRILPSDICKISKKGKIGFLEFLRIKSTW